MRNKKMDRLTDQMFMAQMMSSFVIIIACIAMMCMSAYAYFSSSVTSANNIIQAASYRVEVTPDAEAVAEGEYYKLPYSTTLDAEGKLMDMTGQQVQTNMYTFTLAKSVDSTASTGYVKVVVKVLKDGETEAVEKTLYTQQIGTYLEDGNTLNVPERVLGIEVAEGYQVWVKFVTEWGTCTQPGIVSSTAMLDMEAPDSVTHLSLITTEDYGVEVVELEEVLFSVSHETDLNPLLLNDLEEDEIENAIKDSLSVVLNEEEYTEYVLEYDVEYLDFEEGIVEVPVTVIYPGSETTLRTEVETSIFVKRVILPEMIVVANSSETALELENEQGFYDAVNSALTVYLNEVETTDYSVLVMEEWALSETEVIELTVNVTVVIEGIELEKEVAVFVKKAVIIDEPVEQPKEDPAEQPGEEEPGEEPADQPGEEEPGEDPAEQPGEEEPGEEPADQPGEEEPGEEPADQPVEEDQSAEEVSE